MGDKKMGRPTDDPKTLQMRIRLSDKEKQELEFCSKETGKPKADIIREGIHIIYTQLKEK